MAMYRRAIGAVVILMCTHVHALLDVYTGREPERAQSRQYSVILRQRQSPHDNGTGDAASIAVMTPMVYTSRSPDADLENIHAGIFCSLHGAFFCNRTVSWIEFGQRDMDVTEVSVTLPSTRDSRPLNVSTVRVLPLRAAINITVVDAARRVVAFNVTGGASRPLHLSLEWGSRWAGPGRSSSESAFAHAFYVFVAGPDPRMPGAADVAAGRAVSFGPGEHVLPGDGVLTLPPTLRVIHLARGAWVEGRFNISSQSSGVVVQGHGVMSGSRYTYKGGAQADWMRFVEPSWATPLHLDGPTFVDSKGHNLILPPHSSARGVRIIGWLYNEDGIWVTAHSTVRDSFVRTNDDSVRLYGGAVDGYTKHPVPPRSARGVNITVERMQVHQLFNGAVVQIGWEDTGIVNSTVRALDVLGAEWYAGGVPPAVPGAPSLPPNESAWLGRTNDAVLSLMGPTYDLSMLERHQNITVSDVRIDATEGVGRFLGLGLRGSGGELGSSSLTGLVIDTVVSLAPLRWFETVRPDVGNTSVPTSAHNFLCALGVDSIQGVTFRAVTLAGNAVRRDQDWGLHRIGNVSHVVYQQ